MAVFTGLGSNTAPSFTFSSDTNTGIYSPGANQVAVSTNGTQRISIGSDGDINIDSGGVFYDASTNRLAIGTTSPGGLLHLKQNNSNDTKFIIENDDGQFSIVANDNTAKYQSSEHIFRSASGAVERARIDSAGNVGIGTQIPGGRLHLKQDNSNDVKLIIENDDGVFSIIANDNTVRYQSSEHIFRSASGAQEKARIDTSGRLLVGTVPSPAYKLQLETDSAGKPSTNTWTIVSDERIKEEIELADLDLCYEAVKNIPLKRFKWKDEVYTEEQAYDRRKLGWIAQDVEAVFPKAVRQHEFKYNQVFEEVVIPAVPAELDDDGNIITEEQPEQIEKELISEEVIEDCRDLNSDQLYAAMYGAIQKLISKVETLEAEVAALKA